MHPVPKTSLYPPPAGSMKGRPWWTSIQVEGDGYYNQGTATMWVRRDGWEIRDNGYSHYAVHPDHMDALEAKAAKAGVSDTPESVAAEIDREFPLKAPELRAGQVWLIEENKGQFVELAMLNTNLISYMNAGLEFRYGPTATMQYDLCGWGLNAEEAERLLLHGGSRTMRAYLVHDPVHPASAPWTSYQQGPTNTPSE